jgi:hypothetical protein
MPNRPKDEGLEMCEPFRSPPMAGNGTRTRAARTFSLGRLVFDRATWRTVTARDRIECSHER